MADADDPRVTAARPDLAAASLKGKVERITRVLQLHGPLSQEQRADLVRIADRCPVHRTLENQPLIVTRLAHDD